MQALKNLKPATGGKISGPGTPTSDSIPAQIAETGEPLQVSNQERILSAKQEALLQRIAELLGFESVDALLEAGTGEPVGPTIKGGKKAAATGMPPESEDLTAQPDPATKAAQAPTPAPVKPAPSPAPQGTATEQAQSGLDAPWYSPAYARAANASEKTGLELERDRRAAGVAANLPKDDFMQTLLKTGAMPSAPAATTPAATTPAAPTDAKQAKAAAPANVSPGSEPFGPPKDLKTPTPLEQSSKAFALGQDIDRATGTGPGMELARVGTDPLNRPALFDTMQKRFDAYKSNPELLAMRNTREDLLGSGIRLEKDANGGMLITNSGNTGGTVPGGGASTINMKEGNANGAVSGGGASTINMKEGNEVMARANAIRQSMIDSQRGGVHILGGQGGLSSERQEMLRRALTPHKGAQNGQLTIGQLQAARGIVADAQGEQLRGAEIAQRGGEAGQRAALEAARLAQGLPAMEGQQLQNEQGRRLAALQNKAMNGDQEALSLLQSLSGKGDKAARYYGHVLKGAIGEPDTFLSMDGSTGRVAELGTSGDLTKQRQQQQAVDPRAAAQAAIARGADPAAVNERLRKMGFEEVK